MKSRSVPRGYRITYSVDSEKMIAWDLEMTNIIMFLRKHNFKTDGVQRETEYGLIFGLGLQTAREWMEKEGHASKTQMLSKRVNDVKAWDIEKDTAVELYERVGLDRYVEILEEDGIHNWYEYLEDYKLKPQPEKKWSEITKDWLEEYLSDGLEHDIVAIKEALITDGILDDTDSQTIARGWNKIKVLASREGVSKGERGKWQLVG